MDSLQQSHQSSCKQRHERRANRVKSREVSLLLLINKRSKKPGKQEKNSRVEIQMPLAS